jgi:hypothetical protein
MRLPSAADGSTTSEVGASTPMSRIAPRWSSLSDVVEALVPAPWPLDRKACIAAQDWTIMMTNGLGGTDLGVIPTHFAAEVGRRAVRAVRVEAGDHSAVPGCASGSVSAGRTTRNHSHHR